MKVRNFYNKNQFIITNGAEVVFQSYDSTIARIKNGNLTLFSNWNYSRTTLKYLYLFLNDYKNSLDGFIYSKISQLDNQKNKEEYLRTLITAKIIRFSVR